MSGARAWGLTRVRAAQPTAYAEALLAGWVPPLPGVRPSSGPIERAGEVAQDLAGWVHPGPFRLTRSNIRGALARQIRDDLDADLAEFDIST